MDLEDYIKNLTAELQEKARTCGSVEELLALARESKTPLPDEALEGVAGGVDPEAVGCGEWKCPRCGSTNIVTRDESVPGGIIRHHTCKSCGYKWDGNIYI